MRTHLPSLQTPRGSGALRPGAFNQTRPSPQRGGDQTPRQGKGPAQTGITTSNSRRYERENCTRLSPAPLPALGAGPDCVRASPPHHIRAVPGPRPGSSWKATTSSSTRPAMAAPWTPPASTQLGFQAACVCLAHGIHLVSDSESGSAASGLEFSKELQAVPADTAQRNAMLALAQKPMGVGGLPPTTRPGHGGHARPPRLVYTVAHGTLSDSSRSS